jgi:hypothetical protein
LKVTHARIRERLADAHPSVQVQESRQAVGLHCAAPGARHQCFLFYAEQVRGRRPRCQPAAAGEDRRFFPGPCGRGRVAHGGHRYCVANQTGGAPQYADYPHAYWTGYFTSRPALKGYVRRMSGYLQACRQLEAAAPSASPLPATSDPLSDAMGLAQHHDAVAGGWREAMRECVCAF